MSVSTFSSELELALGPAPRCLVVDDEAQVRRAICRMVGRIGLQCTEADSGATALAHLAREGEVPLVISDIDLPGMNGVELLTELRRRLPDTAVIMVTGVADVGTAVKCLQLEIGRAHV